MTADDRADRLAARLTPAEPPKRWEDTHKRWSVWVSSDVLARVAAYQARTGRSWRAVADELLTAGLDTLDRPEPRRIPRRRPVEAVEPPDGAA